MNEKRKPGRPKKIKEIISNGQETQGKEEGLLEQSVPVQEVAIAKKQKEVDQPKPEREPVRYVDSVLSDAQRIAESRKALNYPLSPGQKFFETPDGEIIVGEADKTSVWSRRMNGGKGGWVNPRR
jgi:hypothetical protein